MREQKMSIKTILAFTTGIFAILFVSSCTPSPVDIIATTTEIPTVVTSTPTLTLTLTPTSTPQPTIAPTATKNPYDLDIEKFYKLPPSYEYFLDHLDEFVKSPDPIYERAAFDKWVSEELYPVLGPRKERQVNIKVDALGNSSNAFNAFLKRPTAFQGNLGFFAFNYQEVWVPTFCVNVARFNPKEVDQTLCVGLFDGIQVEGTEIFRKLATGGNRVTEIDIFKVPNPSGLPVGNFGESFLQVSGDAWIDLPDNVSFGLGMINLTDK
jgi:hypothetical protein